MCKYVSLVPDIQPAEGPVSLKAPGRISYTVASVRVRDLAGKIDEHIDGGLPRDARALRLAHEGGRLRGRRRRRAPKSRACPRRIRTVECS